METPVFSNHSRTPLQENGLPSANGLDDDVLVFGDSGGFQIATGALKWDSTIREKIFHWLEANSDVAANLDIPPRVTFENRFQDSMDIF
jgi:hypothetical protein